MNQTCFTSSDPAAVNASLLYDDSSTSGHLWAKDDPATPLLSCPPSGFSPPPDSSCLVCCQPSRVLVVCPDLPKSVEMVMEAVGESVQISETACPLVDSDGSPSCGVPAAIIVILLLLCILIWLLWSKRRRCFRRPEVQRREEDTTPGENEANMNGVAESLV